MFASMDTVADAGAAADYDDDDAGRDALTTYSRYLDVHGSVTILSASSTAKTANYAMSIDYCLL